MSLQYLIVGAHWLIGAYEHPEVPHRIRLPIRAYCELAYLRPP